MSENPPTIVLPKKSSDRPLTPPAGAATTPQSFAIHSTPHSQGSSSHYSYQSQNHQSDYKPYLKEDLKHQYTVTFDEFLNDILHLAPDWIDKNASRISDIVHTQRFGKMVSKYREPVTHETSRYPPFIVLANHVINQLDHKPDSDICFCRNDPVLVGGSCAERKPDVAGVRCQSLEVSERSSVDNLMKDGPHGACFWWTEVLLFFEFKLFRKMLLEGLVQAALTRDRSSSTSSHCFFRPSIVILIIYVSGSSVNVELSSWRTAFPTYISQTEHVTERARSSCHDHPLRISPISHVVKAQF
jgi:hypothetical protein